MRQLIFFACLWGAVVYGADAEFFDGKIRKDVNREIQDLSRLLRYEIDRIDDQLAFGRR
jgi:hypothetical protein